MPLLMENGDKSQILNCSAAPRRSGAQKSSSSAQLPSAGLFTRGYRGLSPRPETLVSPFAWDLAVLPPALGAVTARVTAHRWEGWQKPRLPSSQLPAFTEQDEEPSALQPGRAHLSQQSCAVLHRCRDSRPAPATATAAQRQRSESGGTSPGNGTAAENDTRPGEPAAHVPQ